VDDAHSCLRAGCSTSDGHSFGHLSRALAMKMLARLRNRMMWGAFEGFRTQVRYLLSLHDLAHVYQDFWPHSLDNSSVTSAQVDASRRAQLARKMLLRLRAKQLYIAFTSLAAYTQDCRARCAKEASASKFLRRLCNKTLYQATQGWVAAIELARRKQNAVVRAAVLLETAVALRGRLSVHFRVDDAETPKTRKACGGLQWLLLVRTTSASEA
jgi:hypothetical protein